jgi:FkbM family methyltransferase
MGDIGANVGVYTILAAKNTGARVIALEPGLAAFQRLEMNATLNQVKEQTELLNCGASSADGELLFTQRMDAVNHVVVEEEANAHQGILMIPVMPLDQILIDEVPLLLKIDVEGYEHEVIKGGKRLLASNSLQAIIIKLNGSGMRYGFNDKNIHEELLASGFLPYRYDPFSRELELLKNPGNFNTLYLRYVNTIKERLLSSRKYNIIGYAI